MPSKEPTHRDDKAVSKQRSPKPIAENPDMLAPQQSYPAAIIQRAMTDPRSLTPRDVLQLQRTVGNRAVGRLLARTRSHPSIQARLMVGAEGDRYEQEADRVADQVLRLPTPAVVQRPGVSSPPDAQRQEDEELQAKPLVASITPLAQRQADEEEEIQAVPLAQRQAEEEEEVQTKPLAQRQAEEEEEVQTKPSLQPSTSNLQASFEAGSEIESRLAAREGGDALPTGVRAYMEPRFGADFSGVRIHTGGEADQLNRQLGAQAFTYGQDIYMRAGKYAPGTTGGNRLLAHELTHVVQQSQGRVRGGRSGMYVRPAGGGLEQEPDAWACRARGQGGDGGRGAGIHGRQGPPGEEGGRCAEQGVIQRAYQFVDPEAATWPAAPLTVGGMVYYTYTFGRAHPPIRSASYGTCAGFALHARWPLSVAGLLAHGWTPSAGDVESVAAYFKQRVTPLASGTQIKWMAWSFGGATLGRQRDRNLAQVRDGLNRAGFAAREMSDGWSEWALDVGSGVLTPSGTKAAAARGGRFAEAPT